MATQKELIERLIIELDSLKKKLPNGEIKRMEQTLLILEKNQNEMKSDIRYIRKTILDPELGLIVRINKNTESRVKREGDMPGYMSIIDDFKTMVTWKSGVQKGLWLLYSAIIGIIIKLLFWD